jgi:hypothetical protein
LGKQKKKNDGMTEDWNVGKPRVPLFQYPNIPLFLVPAMPDEEER